MAKIIPIKYTEDTYHTLGTRFIINDIMCVGYSIVNDTILSVLFALHQDLFDKYAYCNMNIELKTPMEEKIFRKSGMYIKDIQKDQENALRLKEITQHLNSSNLYTTDFNFSYNEDGRFYIAKGMRNTGKGMGEIQEYQIGNSEYIQIMIFIQFLSISMMNSSMFLDDSLKNINIIPAIHSKLDGSVIIEVTNNKTHRNFFKVMSHYTFQCGPTSFRVNYVYNTPTKPSKILREPLVSKQYEAEFKDDLYVTCTIPEIGRDQILVIVVNQKKKSTTVIRLNKELYEMTNLKDNEHYIFYDGIESANPNPVVPHIKF